MLRYWIAILMCSCAVGSTDTGTIESVPVSPDAGTAPSLGKEDKACQPELNGPICRYYYQCNPHPDYGPLDQYSIHCSSPRINWNNCTAFSYDPNHFSDDTWAYCCVHDPAPTVK